MVDPVHLTVRGPQRWQGAVGACICGYPECPAAKGIASGSACLGGRKPDARRHADFLVTRYVVPVEVLSADPSMEHAAPHRCSLQRNEPDTDSRVTAGSHGPHGRGTVSPWLKPER